VDTISTQILIGVPNTIEEKAIKNTLDKKLLEIEQDLLTTDTAYKLTREQSKNWIRFAVVREYPMGMPWEGIEEKKQKQGTTRCGASLGGTLDYIPNPTIRLKKQRVFTFMSAFLRSTNVGIVCDPSIEFIINRP
jgi:hypothetical protein